MYIKVFRFRVSNATSVGFSDDVEKPWYKTQVRELVSVDTITKRINTFIADKKNVQITVTPVDVLYHNNGRSNTIDLVYTVLYDM